METTRNIPHYPQRANAMTLRPCLEPGCLELTQGTRCPRHQRERNRQRLDTPAQKQIRNSGAWRQFSRRWLAAHPLCADCEAGGHVVLAVEVHHEGRRSGGGALFQGPFTSLCTSCHAKRTMRERRGEDPPAEPQP